MKNLKRFAALLLALAMLFALAACGGSGDGKTNDGGSSTTTGGDQDAANTGSDDGAQKPADVEVDNSGPATSTKTTPEGTLVVAYNDEPDSLNPAESSRSAFSIKNIVYETLMIKNYETGEYEPWLATDWTFEDETTLVMNLRDDVKFSNGDLMTAEDVLYTVYRYVNSSRVSSSYEFIDYDACSTNGDTQITIKLKNPTGAALGYISNMMVYNKAYTEQVGEDVMATEPCGTGPFKVDEWTSNYGISYSRNEYYWGGNDVSVEFDNIEVRYYTETTTMMVDFETGALDVATYLAETDVRRIQNGEVEGAKVYVTPSMGIYSFVLYDQFEPFKDERVRQAFAYALDIPAMTDNALGVLGQPATSIFGTGVNYKIDCGSYGYDPDKARELLAEAGYADGFDCLAVATTGNIYTALLETAQAYLADVGINMTIEQYDFSTAITYWQGTQNGGVPVNQVGILQLSPSTGDADQVLTTTKVGSGLTYVECNDDHVQELINKGANTSDPAVRTEAYKELQEYMYEQAYQVPIVEDSNGFAIHDYIDWFDGSAPSCPRFCFTTLK